MIMSLPVLSLSNRLHAFSSVLPIRMRKRAFCTFTLYPHTRWLNLFCVMLFLAATLTCDPKLSCPSISSHFSAAATSLFTACVVSRRTMYPLCVLHALSPDSPDNHPAPVPAAAKSFPEAVATADAEPQVHIPTTLNPSQNIPQS